MRAGAIGTAVKAGNVCGHELSLTCSECRWAAHDCLFDVKPMAEGLRINRVNVLDQGIDRHRWHERHGQPIVSFRGSRLLLLILRERRYSGHATTHTSCHDVWPGRAVQDELPRSTNVRAATMYQVS